MKLKNGRDSLDTVLTTSILEFSWKDRLRILFGARPMVTVSTCTEFVVGRAETTSAVSVPPLLRMKRRLDPMVTGEKVVPPPTPAEEVVDALDSDGYAGLRNPFSILARSARKTGSTKWLCPDCDAPPGKECSAFCKLSRLTL